MSKAGTVPPVVGPAHLVARHQERQTAGSSARPCQAGLPLCNMQQTVTLNLADVSEFAHMHYVFCIDDSWC